MIELDWGGKRVQLEYEWIAATGSSSGRLGFMQPPTIVFLHEGLGSVAMWKDFPERVCQRLGCRGLVYSRPGYGQSSPRLADEVWGVDFMHRQAYEVLPRLLKALHIDPSQGRIWLLGHSDGASIALLYASQFPEHTAGCIALAPHVMVEDITIHSINRVKHLYSHQSLRSKLARYHRDTDSSFWGWCNAWLNPAFKAWNIETELSTLTSPLLLIQGADDAYGSLLQLQKIAQQAPHAKVLELRDCGHSPHIDQTDQVLQALETFIRGN